jgi:hypothetical protein
MRVLLIGAVLGLLQGCISPEHAELKAMRPAFEKALQARDLYRIQAEKAQALLIIERKGHKEAAMAAYVAGVKEGHASVECKAIWPTMEVLPLPHGAFKTVAPKTRP